MKRTKETITATFQFAIEYDTAIGRRKCLKYVRDGSKHIAAFGDYGIAAVKMKRKKGVIQ
tara:strand:- start:270 stop:449 length:180 start_codon:yes stop_codon:yes gene_type:complete